MNLKKIITKISFCIILQIISTQYLYSLNKIVDHKPLNGKFCNNYGKYGYVGQSDYYLCRDGYAVAYNCTSKQPNYVVYILTKKSVLKYIKRKNQFSPDLSLPKKCQSQLSDYRKSGFDRGHLTPYASIDFSPRSAKQSFLLSNISPQRAGLNRKGWAKLEQIVRSWAIKKRILYVYTGVIFDDDKNKTIGPNKVIIPKYFYKVIYAPKLKKVLAFLMPNKYVPATKQAIINSQVSVKEIEDLTGYNFFPNLPGTKKNKKNKLWAF